MKRNILMIALLSLIMGQETSAMRPKASETKKSQAGVTPMTAMSPAQISQIHQKNKALEQDAHRLMRDAEQARTVVGSNDTVRSAADVINQITDPVMKSKLNARLAEIQNRNAQKLQGSAAGSKARAEGRIAREAGQEARKAADKLDQDSKALLDQLNREESETKSKAASEKQQGDAEMHTRTEIRKFIEQNPLTPLAEKKKMMLRIRDHIEGQINGEATQRKLLAELTAADNALDEKMIAHIAKDLTSKAWPKTIQEYYSAIDKYKRDAQNLTDHSYILQSLNALLALHKLNEYYLSEEDQSDVSGSTRDNLVKEIQKFYNIGTVDTRLPSGTRGYAPDITSIPMKGGLYPSA